MGDNTIIAVNENSAEASESSANKKPSIELLKTEEKADLTNDNAESFNKVDKNEDEAPAKIEMVFEKKDINQLLDIETPLALNPSTETQEVTNTMQSAESGRLNKLRDHSSNIFPAGIMGCRDEQEPMTSPRRFLDAKEASNNRIGHIQNTPRKRPSSAKNDSQRNCVTGAGVNATDEVKSATGRRKDGNPLLGEGYERKVSSSSTRIPPGGFSQGLW